MLRIGNIVRFNDEPPDIHNRAARNLPLKLFPHPRELDM